MLKRYAKLNKPTHLISYVYEVLKQATLYKINKIRVVIAFEAWIMRTYYEVARGNYLGSL